MSPDTSVFFFPTSVSPASHFISKTISDEMDTIKLVCIENYGALT